MNQICVYFSLQSKKNMQVEFATITLAAIAILCNTLLILAIIVDPLGLLRKGAWVTILNLAVADFLTCANNFAGLFLFITEETDELNHEIWRGVLLFFWMFGMSASFMFLTLLTVQVYMIIKCPIKSRLILTNMKVALACLVVWVLAILSGLGAIVFMWIQQRKKIYFQIANFTLVTLVVVIQVVFKILIVVEISMT